MYPTTVGNETGQRRPRSREITALSVPSQNVSLSRRPLRCGRQKHPELQAPSQGWGLEWKSRQESSPGSHSPTASRQAGDKRGISSDQVSTPLSREANHPLLLAPPLDSYSVKRDKERWAASLGSSSPTPEAQASGLAVVGLKPALKRKLEPH